METRCGDFDTGAILYLAHEKGLSTQQIEHLLYKESGLLGISGISGDPRKLLISDQPSAKLAIEMFTLRCAGEIGRMMVTLGGLETLIFTGGIGEHLPEIRAQICQRLLRIPDQREHPFQHRERSFQIEREHLFQN